MTQAELSLVLGPIWEAADRSANALERIAACLESEGDAMRAGRLNKWVTLSRSPQSTNDSDGFFDALDPPGVWAAIRPSTAGDERTLLHDVEIRYHPQVTIDTRILYGTRQLFVKGCVNVDEANVALRLQCEEIVP